MSDVITSIEQVTPEWLTEALRRAGVLPVGEVAAVEARSAATTTATAIPINLRYSDDAPESAPRKLFLKLGRRKSEVDFYHHIYPALRDVPTIRCYDAAFANELGCSHLLMDDISDTHVEPPEALPAPVAICEKQLDRVAALHAQFWESPRLSGDLRPVLDDVTMFVFRQAQANFAHFVDVLGDRLSDKRRGWYERVLASWPLPAWKARVDACQAVTLVHGDTHFWNFLQPKDDGPILLIDWAVWHLNLGPYDAAYMLAQLCYPEWRARFEARLVRHYHQRLMEYGVGGYDWGQCWEDYRLSVVYHTIWPIFHHNWAPPGVWWRNLECVMSAFEDLGCEEMLS
jgi:hypothetical protein